MLIESVDRWRQALRLWLLLPALGLFALMWLVASQKPPGRSLLAAGDRTSYCRVAAEIRSSATPGARRAIYVYGEPALFFQLRAAGELLVAPAPTIPPRQTMLQHRIDGYFAFGPHALTDEAFRTQWSEARDDWELAGEYELALSPLVHLDLFDPRRLDESHQRRVKRIELYRWRKAQ